MLTSNPHNPMWLKSLLQGRRDRTHYNNRVLRQWFDIRIRHTVYRIISHQHHHLNHKIRYNIQHRIHIQQRTYPRHNQRHNGQCTHHRKRCQVPLDQRPSNPQEQDQSQYRVLTERTDFATVTCRGVDRMTEVIADALLEGAFYHGR